MTTNSYFNDAPILTPDDDHFGIDRFAQTLAKSLRDIKSPVGTTIAINGQWGSGKSSAVNLIRHHLKEDVERKQIELIDFKCWWFRGEEALTLAFLQSLNATLTKNLSSKANELIPRIGKTLLQAGPIVGPAINLATGGVWGTFASGSMNFIKRYFPEGENIEKLFENLSNALEEQDKRYLVLIDDIDRLTPDEALIIFRLVKSVGRLPNVIYLLVFDRILAEKAVKEKYPSEGPHFLEKIIQASFDLPLPARDDLNIATLSQIEGVCGSLNNETGQLVRFMNLFYDAVSPYINTPRDLTRLSNAMTVSWPAVANEVDLGDYLALETMRLFEADVYNSVRISKDRLCGVRPEYGRNEDTEQEMNKLLINVSDERRQRVKTILTRLFPRLENMGYGIDFIETWERQRRACTTKHFDTYFRMSVGNETLSKMEIETFIDQSGDKEFVKQAFLEALKTVRKNGKSKVPLLLDELIIHASAIEKSKFLALISAIFEISDDINRKEDRERGFSFGDNQLRILWLMRRLTLDKCTLEERGQIIIQACQDAQLGWLVYFTRVALWEYFPREGKEPELPERCLVARQHIQTLKEHALKAITNAAAVGDLISHPELPSILFRWRDFTDGDETSVKKWTNSQLAIDDAVAMLANAFTGESWTHGGGMFGVGDRVATRIIRASVDGLESIVDVEKFRYRLEELEKRDDLDNELKEKVSTFLEGWRRRDAGYDG
jgi:predicted KAP-like P-loop ATPase